MGNVNKLTFGKICILILTLLKTDSRAPVAVKELSPLNLEVKWPKIKAERSHLTLLWPHVVSASGTIDILLSFITVWYIVIYLKLKISKCVALLLTFTSMDLVLQSWHDVVRFITLTPTSVATFASPVKKLLIVDFLVQFGPLPESWALWSQAPLRGKAVTRSLISDSTKTHTHTPAMKIDFSKWLAFLLQDFKLISNRPKLISKTKKCKIDLHQLSSNIHNCNKFSNRTKTDKMPKYQVT